MTSSTITPVRTTIVAALCWLGCTGCGNQFQTANAPLFVTQVSISGESIGDVIIDTGGGYELMLRNRYGLRVVDEADVLAFAGQARVGITEPFSFLVGGVEATADAAIVGRSICDCNGLGFFFFRKSGLILGLDYASGQVRFDRQEPTGGVRITFTLPPSNLTDFDSAFIEVDVTNGQRTRSVLALLDTGTNGTVLRRGFIGDAPPLSPNRQSVTIVRPEFGAVALRAALFDTPGLPDLIIGTDVMRHRVLLTFEADAEEIPVESVIERIFDRVETP